MNSYNPFISRLTGKSRIARPFSAQAQREHFIADRIDLPVLQVNNNGDITYANNFFCEFFAIQHDQILRLSLFDIDNDIDASDWPGIWQQLQEKHRHGADSTLVHGSGHAVPTSLVFHLYRDRSGEHAFIFIHPHSTAPAAEQDCEGLHHPITGLPRRKLLLRRLEQAASYADHQRANIMVLSLALDRFDLIRDIAGINGADNVLRTIAERLAEFADSKDMIAHVEDDEFAIVRVQRGNEDVSALGKKIIATLSEAICIGGHDFYVTTSMGAAVYPEDGTDQQSIYHYANSSLHLARSNGRGVFRRFQTCPEKHLGEMHMRREMGLKQALRNDHLELYYQPRVDAISGHIVAVEALLRWNHPDHGVILPEHFIPLAEETDLILTLGEWVLRRACQQYRLWINQGIAPERIAVNLSPRQFSHSNLVELVSTVLTESELQPEQLELELTESTLMEDVDAAANTLQELKQLGVHLALDDFGIGHSCLNHIRRFPFNTLKIDKAFVAEMTSDPNSTAIVDVVIALSRRLQMQVVAEGVETLDQLITLRTGGCQQIQGFLFSRPLPYAVVSELLTAKVIEPPRVN
ncbi:MAG: EAL domain-containing protein [Alcanivoracaceae bacterium]|nr:EAL domain-containing protein [Alcanivoracaceae bacterium]